MKHTRLTRILRRREISILIAFVVITAITTGINPAFLDSSDGWRALLLDPSIYVVLAVGQAFVIITKNVDLSVGSAMGLTAWTVGSTYRAWHDMPTVLAFVLGIAIGVALGFLNGALVAVAKVPGMVITLGMMYVLRGVTIMWAGSGRINSGDLSDGFQKFGNWRLVPDFIRFGDVKMGAIPALTVLAVLVLLAAGWYLRNHRTGRELYAIGSSPGAAELIGLPLRKLSLAAFMISGAMAGLAGVMFAARYATIASNAGTGYELQAIGAAVIGGVAIVGGSGTVWGAAAGALLLTTINAALPIMGVDSLWQDAVVGVLIIGAIILDRVLARRTERRLVAQRYAPVAPRNVSGAPRSASGAQDGPARDGYAHDDPALDGPVAERTPV
jgi:rhamnose transport system permease protein